MMKYLEKISERGEKYIELEHADNRISIIPMDLANKDYQRYVRWLNGKDEAETL